MCISLEAKSMMILLNILKRIELVDASEDFDMFYVFMERAEWYAEKYKPE